MDITTVILARRLFRYPNRYPNLRANDLYAFSNLIKLQDRTLSILFWKKALSEGVNDDLVGAMINLGFQLGQDQECEPLFSRMTGLSESGEGGLRSATLHDLVNLNRQWQEQRAKLNDAYEKGNAPIHAIVDSVGQPLVNYYHSLLQKNKISSQCSKESFLLIRHGGRALQPGFPNETPNWRLNLDITSVLMAEHLEILAGVEQVFKPLRIQRNLVPTLIAMQDQVTPGQPSRLKSYRNIIGFLEQGLINVIECELPIKDSNKQIENQLGRHWVSLFERATTEEGHVVDFLPLNNIAGNDSPVEIPPNIHRKLVNCRAIVEALYINNIISEVEYIESLRQVGREGQKSISETVPDIGSKLFCNNNILSILADTESLDLLRTVTGSFQIYIEKKEIDGIRLELQDAADNAATVSWLTTLINRISNGIDTNLYELLPIPPKKRNNTENPLEDKINTRCLTELLHFEPQQNDVIWVDDRYVNGFLRRDSNPIIGINEVLKALVAAKALGITAYYQKLILLREFNTRFIPVESEEILHHLAQTAMNEDGAIMETRGLIVLRQYIADCLIRGNILQRPPMPGGSANMEGETAFIVGLGREVTASLVEIWKGSKENQAMCAARAHWVIQNLYTDTLGMLKILSWQKEAQEDHSIVAISLVGLISNAMGFVPSQVADETSDRHRYFDWLYAQVLEKRLKADPNLTGVIAKFLGRLLPTLQKESAEEYPNPEVSFLLHEFYHDLPKPIRDELGNDTGFTQKMGLKFRNVTRIEGLDFNHGDFLRAAVEAINGRSTTLGTIDSGQHVTVSPVKGSDGAYELCLVIPPTNEKKNH